MPLDARLFEIVPKTSSAALTLPAAKWTAVAGLASCLLQAFSLPVSSVIGGAAVLGLGLVVHLWKGRA